MSKGENDVEDLEVAIKSKGGDCLHYDSGMALWLYDTGVVLDGNSLKWQWSVQALKMMEIKRLAGEWFKRCGPAGSPSRRCSHTRRLPVQKVRNPSSLTSRQRSALTWGFLCLARGI